MTKTFPDTILLATENADLGLIAGCEAIARAQNEATAENATVYIRDPVTDEILATVKPLRVPPNPRGVIELLRKRGHVVTVRQQKTGSLRYRIDGGRDLTALQMDRFYSKTYE